MLPARDRGLPGSKKDEGFLLRAGDEGICARDCIVRSVREGLGRIVRLRVASGGGAMSSGSSMAAVVFVPSSYSESMLSEVLNTSEGRRVRVNRLLKIGSSISAGIASTAGSSSSGRGSVSTGMLGRRWRCGVAVGVIREDALGVVTGGCIFSLAGGRPVLASRESLEADARNRGLRAAGGLWEMLERRESLETEARSLEVRVSPSPVAARPLPPPKPPPPKLALEAGLGVV